MDRILNVTTGVIHEREDRETGGKAACGALQAVDTENTRVVDGTYTEENDHVQWCGRCFDRGGGY